MSTTNTFNSWNEKHPQTKIDNGDWILINCVDTEADNKDAFSLSVYKQPSKKIGNKFSLASYDKHIFDSIDMAEILRGDYQKLVFDIDVKGIELEYYIVSIYQLKTIIQTLGIPIENVHGVLEVKSLDSTKPFESIPEFDIVDSLKSIFPNLHVFTNSAQSKDISIHIFCSGYFLCRNDLFDIFSKGKNHYYQANTYVTETFDFDKFITVDKSDSESVKLGYNIKYSEDYANSVNYLGPYIDVSVFKKSGAQQVFRFALSGKNIIKRKCPVFTEEQYNDIKNNFTDYVATKTFKDTEYISNTSKYYNDLKLWLDRFKLKVTKSTKKSHKSNNTELVDNIKSEIDNIDNTKKHITKSVKAVKSDKSGKTKFIGSDDESSSIDKAIREENPHIDWVWNLVKQIQIYRIEYPGATEEELFNEFIQEKYQYYSHSAGKKLRQDCSVKWAIDKAMKSSKISIKDIINHLAEIRTVNSADTCFKYTLDEFKEAVQYGIDYVRLAVLVHYTFVFFTNADSERHPANKLAYLDSHHEFQLLNFNEFLNNRCTNPISAKLIRRIVHLDKRYSEPKETIELSTQTLSMKQVFDIYDRYKQKYYDYDIYSTKKDIFSLYNKPVKASNTPCPKEVRDILEIIATENRISEKTGKAELEINDNKIEYILNWFAYIVQHPEDRNRIALHIVSAQGVGKNLLSNSICWYLGKEFAEANLNIDNILGTFTASLDTKLFMVVNEIDQKEKNVDKLKSIITDDQLRINKKYGDSYTGKNKASYLFYSNHRDTKIISNGDRRFTYINSAGKPKEKSWYVNLATTGGMLKDEIRIPFINHLLSRDLSKYNPDIAEEFDKIDLLDENRDLNRSSVHSILLAVLKLYNNHGRNFIGVEEYRAIINSTLKKLSDGISKHVLQSKFMEELNSIIDNFKANNSNDKINIEGSNDIITEKDNNLLEEIDRYENDLKVEFGKDTITAKVLNKIINFDDDKDITKFKCGTRGNYKNKWVIALKENIKKSTKEVKSVQNNSTEKIIDNNSTEKLVDNKTVESVDNTTAKTLTMNDLIDKPVNIDKLCKEKILINEI